MVTKPLVSDYLVPPGHYVREALEHYGMTQSELAERTGRPTQAISEIVNGKKEVTEETAFEFESVLGTPAHVWLNLECIYRYGKETKERSEQLDSQIASASQYPYNELAKLGYVPTIKDPRDRVANLLRFFGVARLDLVSNSYSAAFRTQPKKQPKPEALAAWLRIGELLAGQQELAPFDRAALRKAIPELRKATQTEGEIDSVLQRILGPCGVAFVKAPHLEKTYADGAAYWHGRHPVVLLSLRGEYRDRVWFTLFHELGHLLLHESSATFIEGLGATSQQEQEADDFACESLIPKKHWDGYLSCGDYSEEAVIRFAATMEVSPSVVVGRLMHDHEAYNGYHHLRHLRGKMFF